MKDFLRKNIHQSAQLRLLVLLAVSLLAACASQTPKLPTPEQAYGAKPAYNYPLEDPYAATIITVPPAMRVDYSAVPEPADRSIVLFKSRHIPEGFWYQNGLKYAELLQAKPAPLVYIISGTGADAHAAIMRTIANILYAGGYSVVLLPSPTNPNFIINASENYLPGNPAQDARDLYRVMLAIDTRVSHEASITDHMLVGYSLGAWDAAFTARLDSQEQALNFKKVLLINPPYSLYSSMQILDDDLNRAMPHGMDDAGRFVKNVITRLSSLQTSEAFDFESEHMLLDYYNAYHPSDDRLATIIGLSFRLSAADMIFTSDVMRRAGYIFPKNQPFTTSADLNLYMAVALRTNFVNYLNDMFYEEQHAKNPAVTKQSIVVESSLQALAPYIAANPRLWLITNRDDLILAPGDLNHLVQLFDGRATVFPNGGHLGNIALPAMAWQILADMRQR